MSTQPVQEFMNKGLVNVRDGSLLAPGELQECLNCCYRPFDPAIHAAPGRAAIHITPFNAGTTAVDPDGYVQAAGKIKGLAWLSTDSMTDQLLAYNGTGLYLADFTAITGLTWRPIQGIGTLSDDGTEQMTVVKYDTAYYILNGRDRGRRVAFVNPTSLTVTTCTIASLRTVTSTEAGIFSTVMVGQSVTGTNISVGTTVAAKNYTVVAGVYSITSLTLSQDCTNGSGLTLVFVNTGLTNSRVMGMIPTAAMLTPITVNNGAGYGWSEGGVYGGDGYYWVFYTEASMPADIDNYASGFIESAATVKDSELLSFHITAYATQGVTVTRNPNLWNDGSEGKVAATHWIVYLSPKSDDVTEIPARNLFIRVGVVPISVPTMSISTTATTSPWYFGTATEAVGGAPVPTNPGGCLLPGGSSAHFGYETDYLRIKTFTIPTSVLTVTGIELEVYVTPSGQYPGALDLFLERLDSVGDVIKSSTGVQAQTAYNRTTFLFGGAYDTLTESPTTWSGSDFFDSGVGSFCIRLVSHGGHMSGFWFGALDVDYVRIKIHYAGFAKDTLGAYYRTVTYRSQVGTTVVDSAALPPPAGASTGAIYQGQLVLNSPSTRNAIFFSQPGFPEYFPYPYFMTFNSPKKDIVTCIHRVGTMLIVGLQDTIHRVNYLPTELNTDGVGGPAYEPIATDHGICGPLGGVVVDMPGLGSVLAYVSYKGIHYTAGARAEFLNTDLDWLKTVKKTALSTATMSVYPAMNWVILLYCPYGALHNRNTRMLIFDYSPDKVKQGGVLPAIGPITVSGRSVAAATLNGVDYLLTGHEADGLVYAEDQGHSIPAPYYTQEVADPATHALTKNTPVIRTRLFYAAGLERDTRVERTYLRYDNDGTTIVVAACVLTNPAGIGTITKTGAFAATYTTLPGQTVSGIGIHPGTVVVSATANAVVLSHAVDIIGTVTITFDTGTLEIAVRVQGMRDSLTTVEAGYISTHEGNLNDIHLDDMGQAFELQIRKAALPNGSLVDLGTAMRLHYFTTLISEAGMETSRPV
jgi:hypothetical protein